MSGAGINRALGMMNTPDKGSVHSKSETASRVKESIAKVRNAQQFINKIRNQMYEMKKTREWKKPSSLGQIYKPNGIQVCTITYHVLM